MGLFDRLSKDESYYENSEPVGSVDVSGIGVIEFATLGESEKERTPVCPDCEGDIQIHPDTPDGWTLTCDCESTPTFKIERKE